MARKPKTAISYVLSSTSQSKGRQRSQIASYSDEHGLTLAEEFVDDPTSNSRRGLGEALIAVRDGVAPVVLVAKADRLGETLVEQQATVARSWGYAGRPWSTAQQERR